MSDAQNPTPPVESFPQMPDFNSTYLDDVEVVIEDPASRTALKPEDVKAMQDKIAEQDKRITELTAQGDSVKALQAGMAGIAQSLRAPGGAPVPQQQIIQQVPGETDEIFQKRVDEGLLERGATATVEEIFSRKLRPEVQRLLQNNLINSRRFVILDSARGPMYTKYKADVEALVAALPPDQKLYDPEVYEKAVDRIASLHANEIIDERVQQAVAVELEKIRLAAPPATSKPPLAAAVHAEVGQRPPPGAVRREVKLTTEEAKYAKDHLIPPAAYADYLVRKGLKK